MPPPRSTSRERVRGNDKIQPMTEPIRLVAGEQHDHFTGTAALDQADFESYEEILGLADCHILGLTVGADHHSLGMEGKDHADESYTELSVLVLRDDQLPAEGGLPALLASGDEIPVVRISYLTPDSSYPDTSPLNALSILQRGAKRMSFILWDRTLQEAGLDSLPLRVVQECTMEHTETGWREVA